MEKDILKKAKKKIEKREYSDDIEDVKKALAYKDERKRYEFIYDRVCKILDEKFERENFCDFKNDKCIANRKGAVTHKDMGCCYSYRQKGLLCESLGLCKYMQDRKCTQVCISCKFFVCDYLKKQGICFEMKSFLLLELFFNRKQKEILRCNFFRKKKQIIDKLMERDYTPYILYIIFDKYLVKE